MKIYPLRPTGSRRRKAAREEAARKIHPALFFFSRLSFACAGLLALGQIGFYAYSHFQPIRAVEVRNNEALSAEYLRNMAGANEMRSFAEIDPFEISAALSSIGWIDFARARRLPPDRLEIYVRERVPVAFFRTRENFFLIDAEGVLLEPLKTGEARDLPVIVDESLGNEVSAGDKLVSGVLLNAMGLMELLRESEVIPLDSVSEIIISDPINIELITMPHNLRVKMGLDHFPQKILNLHYAESEIRKNLRRTTTVDLRYLNRIVLGK